MFNKSQVEEDTERNVKEKLRGRKRQEQKTEADTRRCGRNNTPFKKW